ncbi:MAG: Type 1 glutamine amidotransferase-like domain-containing protein [Candidatus Melainabacteria bacterium]|nr:Type 1 glutamine amidotransferase-like domain-containing protein [Candidatus Melainabacteria bacterium]
MKSNIILFGVGGQPVTRNYLKLLDLASKGKKGYQPHIAIIGHAARDPVTDCTLTAGDFTDLQARVTILTPGSHKRLPAEIDAIYMRGGDQSRMMEALRKDGLVSQILEAAEKGIIIAGNSAGTAALSKRMIAGGMEDETLIACGQLLYGEGLGFFDKLVMDTHVDRYHRENRDLAICAENPGTIVVGVDEGTAAQITPADKGSDLILEVSGSNHVRIVSQTARFWSNLTANSCRRGEGGRSIIGLQVDILSLGDRALIPASRKAEDIKLLDRN